MTESQQLIYEIMGKRYILVDVPYVEGMYKEVKRLIKTHGLLYQGIKSISRGGMFTKSVVVQTYLCPEENYLSFSQDNF